MKAYGAEMANTVCPVCGASEARQLWQASSVEAAQHYVLKEADRERNAALASAIEFIWDDDQCRVLRCEECEFAFSDPYRAGDGHFYELAFQRSGYPEWKWEYEVTLEAVRRLPQRKTYLEVGAGNGAFVSRIVPSLMAPEDALCTEFSPYGRDCIGRLGVRCEALDVRNLTDPAFAGRFDVVCLFQVLEHLDELDNLFHHLRWLCADGASLFIAVPNPHRIEFNELNGALMDMPPNHIGRYTQATFSALCRRWRWEMLDYRMEQSSFAEIARSFSLYRFLRKAQDGKSVENRIMRIGDSRVRKMAQLLAVAWHALLALPALFSMSRQQRGMSQWVHLRKLA